MTDEIALHKATTKAARAQELLSNEMLKEAFQGLRGQYSADLMGTTVDQAEARERLYLAHRIVNEVERHLANIVNDGKLAAAELRQLTEAATRKPRWQDI